MHRKQAESEMQSVINDLDYNVAAFKRRSKAVKDSSGTFNVSRYERILKGMQTGEVRIIKNAICVGGLNYAPGIAAVSKKDEVILSIHYDGDFDTLTERQKAQLVLEHIDPEFLPGAGRLRMITEDIEYNFKRIKYLESFGVKAPKGLPRPEEFRSQCDAIIRDAHEASRHVRAQALKRLAKLADELE